MSHGESRVLFASYRFNLHIVSLSGLVYRLLVLKLFRGRFGACVEIDRFFYLLAR
jgi:hypothetical protein